MWLPSSLLALSWLSAVRAVTVYGQTGIQVPTAAVAGGASSAVAPTPSYTPTGAAYNNLVLTAPAIPSPAPNTSFTIPLSTTAQGVGGLSIPQSGAFLGFSIEMSVVNQVIGINASFLQVPFLNLMANIKERAGEIRIRVGGNTQEYATLVPSLPDGKAIEKDKGVTTNPTDTPTLVFTPEILYMMANVTKLVNAKWYLGIPFNDTTNLRLAIAEYGERILGDNLLALQVGNEPDLYASHGHRPSTYSQFDYFGDFGVVVAALANDSNIPVRNNLLAPSVSGTWTPESVFDTGFIQSYASSLGGITVERYPDNNCAAAFPNAGFGPPIDPQTVFANYLTHASGQNIIAPYLNTSNVAQAAGKPFLMFETNSASCGGFPGVSDSFGAALWALDYGLQMAYANFSGALLHVGGIDDTYNPFMPPPTNMSKTLEWTIGPIYYSVLAVAEAFGTSGKAQIVDLFANSANALTPGYAVYESGNLAKVALFNYMTDPSGANDYSATVAFSGGAAPASVVVKYLLAPSVSEKFNITWAGQTLGGRFKCDGRLQGTETLQTVACDTTANTCTIHVPAPGFALVFIAPSSSSDPTSPATATFSTTAVTRVGAHTATVDQAVLATSNGHSGSDRQQVGTTSKGSVSGAVGGAGRGRGAVVGAAVAAVWGALIGMGVLRR